MEHTSFWSILIGYWVGFSWGAVLREAPVYWHSLRPKEHYYFAGSFGCFRGHQWASETVAWGGSFSCFHGAHSWLIRSRDLHSNTLIEDSKNSLKCSVGKHPCMSWIESLYMAMIGLPASTMWRHSVLLKRLQWTQIRCWRKGRGQWWREQLGQISTESCRGGCPLRVLL